MRKFLSRPIISRIRVSAAPARCFRVSTVVYGPKGKKGKSTSNDEDGAVELPNLGPVRVDPVLISFFSLWSISLQIQWTSVLIS